MKIAFVHDYLVQYGGAERVLECLLEIFPYAPIYTLMYNPDAMHGAFVNNRIYTSSLQRIPFAKYQHRIFPLFMPAAIEQFDFSPYDVVVSDSSSYAKGIITKTGTLHISYVHTPMRYAWDDCQKYTEDFYFPRIIKKIIPFAMNYLRLWDRASADRIDRCVANSQFVSRRIQKYYHKESMVIYPPVDTNLFSVSETHDEYYLMVGRLIAYKRHDVAIEAFNRLGKPLKIIGRGPEYARLKKMARKNIEFLGRVPDEQLPHYYSRCKGFIFPQEEDFGIVAIEAMASGRPLIAFRAGDIVEHMQEGVSGVFFDRQTPQALIAAVEKFEMLSFDAHRIRSQALKFDRKIFKENMKNYIEKELERHRSAINQ